MPYCANCGKEVYESDNFCPYCGITLRKTAKDLLGIDMGFKRLASDQRVQRHWLERFVAYIIDSVLVTLFTVILLLFLSLPLLLTGFWRWWNYWDNFFGMTSLLGVVYLLYFSLMEGFYGYTFGKNIMNLEVVAKDGGPPTMSNSFIRSLSKTFWAFLIVDLVLGFATKGDPMQRFTDKVAGTMVIERRGRREQNIFSF